MKLIQEDRRKQDGRKVFEVVGTQTGTKVSVSVDFFEDVNTEVSIRRMGAAALGMMKSAKILGRQAGFSDQEIEAMMFACDNE